MVEGISEWFVIGEHKELTAFEVVSKMTYREVNREKFTTKRTVSGFCWLEAFGEETEWLPNVIDFLLENCTDSNI